MLKSHLEMDNVDIQYPNSVFQEMESEYCVVKARFNTLLVRHEQPMQ